MDIMRRCIFLVIFAICFSGYSREVLAEWWRDSRIIKEIFSSLEKQGLRSSDLSACREKILEALSHDVMLARDAKVCLKQNLNDEYFRVITPREWETHHSGVNKTVYGHRAIADGVGYIRVSEFSSTTALSFREALRLYSYRDPPSIIVDVRNNRGGDLSIVLEMIRYFSDDPEDIILTYRTRQRDTELTVKNPFGCRNVSERGHRKKICVVYVYPHQRQLEAPGQFKKFRIVVLINKESASASEIFAGTLQDWGRRNGTVSIVGVRSYGKGVGQCTKNVPGGFKVKFTCFEFFVGNSVVAIHNIGVLPDIKVAAPEGIYPYVPIENDIQLQVAIAMLVQQH